jgi:hypothetical protein
MTGISAEREYIRDGKITKMVIVELTDARYLFNPNSVSLYYKAYFIYKYILINLLCFFM